MSSSNTVQFDLFKRPAWSFSCVKGDLFSTPVKYSLAHCVGSDLCMGAGIAVVFKRKFGRVDELRRQNIRAGGVAVLRVGSRFVYYLVTKRLSTQKPKLSDLLKSLLEMRSHMKANGVVKIAIPRIGCGLDRFKWKDVFDMLERVFSKLPIEMVLYDNSSKHE